jgi:voltage-gated potassium channel
MVHRPRGLARNQDAYDRFSVAVDGPLLILAVAWLPVLIWPLIAHPSAGAADALNAVDYLVWAAFVVEYAVKLYLAPKRGQFVRTHLVDLAVIVVPFLRPLRAARLIRVVRSGTTLVVAWRRVRRILTHRGLHFVLLSVAGLLFVGSAIEYAVEVHVKGSNIHSFGDSLWWGVVTLTTVGYGDRFPVTAAGRGVAVVLMLAGIGLVGVLTATVASYFVEESKSDQMAQVEARLERIEALLRAGAEQPKSH